MLQFDPSVYAQIADAKRKAQDRNTMAPFNSANQFAQTVTGLGQDVQGMQVRQQSLSRQQMLDQYLKQENDRKRFEFDRQNTPQGQLPGWGGDPMVQPTQDMGMPGATPSNPFYGAPTQSQQTQESPLISRWKSQFAGQPKPLQDAYTNPRLSRADVADQVSRYGQGLGFQKEQSEITKNLREPSYVIPQFDAQGNMTGMTPLPAGVKPTSFVRPQPVKAGQGGTPNKYLQAQIAKAQAELANTRPLVNSAVSELTRIEPLNTNSRGGMMGAGVQKASSMFNVGTSSPEFTNTADVINTLKSQVVKVLKSSFGGQLSDGERQYLNEVYGAVDHYTPAERAIAIKNVKTMLANKLAGSESAFKELSDAGGGQQDPGNSDPLGLGL